MRVTYIINQYPKVSHTFIRREILALERLGFSVQRIAMRGWNAVVIDPHDEATWIAQLQHLADDAEFRAKLAHKSKLKALYYLWDAVAKRRLDLLENALKIHDNLIN